MRSVIFLDSDEKSRIGCFNYDDRRFPFRRALAFRPSPIHAMYSFLTTEWQALI
jgi:hypothetical protein